MKQRIRVVAFLMCLFLLATTFAACGKPEQNPQDSGSRDSATQAPPAQTTAGGNGDSDTPTEKPTEIRTAEQLAVVVAALNANPDASKGKTYVLKADIQWASWDAKFSLNGSGKMNKPGISSEWKPIAKFYGTFDGNGKTVSGLYADSRTTDGVALFGELCDGAVVKDLTVENSFFASKGGVVAGIARATSGTVSIENVTVGSYLFVEEGSLAGFVGKVNGALTIQNSVFNGVLGTIDGELTVPSAKTDISIGQMVADGADQSVTLKDCTAKGLIYTAGTSDAWCAAGASKLVQTGGKTEKSTLDFSEDAILIYTAEDLLKLSASAAAGETFEGKIIKLMNDIDLNPGWSAASEVVADGADPAADPTTADSFTVTFPTAPANKWRPIRTFKGTFDGQGFAIKGLYVDYVQIHDATESKTADGYDIYPDRSLGLFANCSGTVKNLVLTNGIMIGRCDTTNIRIGSVIGSGSGTVQNVYSDLELWAANKTIFNNIGGIVGRFTGNAVISDCVFAGKIGSLPDPFATQGPSSVSTFVSAAAGSCGNAEGSIIKNCLNLAMFYHASKGNKTDFGNEASKTTLTNNLVGKKEASFLTGTEGAAYATDWEYNELLGYVVPKTVSELFR